jgi:16S rRNA (guanine(966)-N(2))-methyltransferase RsmD
MSIRVAGGYLKGRILKTLPGRTTRPTPARVRESVFSILQHDIGEAEVLDLFSGSGALAIEAVSRGAASAVLVEKNPRAAAVIRQNLAKCDLDLRLIIAGHTRGLDILSSEKKKFSLVFADPPYGLVTPDDLFNLLLKYSLMSAGGFFIMEHSSGLKPELEENVQTRRFGDSAVSIFNHE